MSPSDPLSRLQSANGRRLKRSYTSVTVSASSSPERPADSSLVGAHARKVVKQQAQGDSVQAPSRGRGLHRGTGDMPSAAGPRVYEHYLPSFMSVYDMDQTVVESQDVEPPTKAAPTYISPLPHRPLQNNQEEATNDLSQAPIHSHKYRPSTSTQASDSTDSSPTTTISTVDSSSLSDPSPSSSPESPIILLPLSAFSGTTFGMDSFKILKVADPDPVRAPLSDERERPMTSPQPRKHKNPKSLALNLNSNIDGLETSEPTSPSFIKPPTLSGRKRPSLLSLNTGAANTQPLGLAALASPGIPSMLQRRSLKHSISSPQMLITPGFGPLGGMTLGGDRNPPRLAGASRLKESNLVTNTFTINEDADQEQHPGATQMATRVPGVAVGGDTFDRPHSGEDAQSPSYPNGPILMHDPSVHLYLEPKREEAMEFDVVINVAREVKNPFLNSNLPVAKENSAPVIIPEIRTWAATPGTAASTATFETAFEVQPSSTESSPTTPKASPQMDIPEYIHIPWDHNTDVKDELWDLCETIETRVKQGKKVLVHCQQGASRSATLIIAYGMFINQDLTANEAYARAQAKSKWVNPNMSLLFSLNDFKKIIDAKKAEKERLNAARQIKHRSANAVETAESPITPTRARGNSTPSSAARDKALATYSDDSASTAMSDHTIKRLADFDFGFNEPAPAAPPQIPVESQQPIQPDPIERLQSFGWEDELMSPRLTEMTDNPLEAPFSPTYPQPFQAQPISNVIFPPRTFGYPRSSFFSTVQQSLGIAAEDPRSPPTRGEVPIPRSIDDFL